MLGHALARLTVTILPRCTVGDEDLVGYLVKIEPSSSGVKFLSGSYDELLKIKISRRRHNAEVELEQLDYLIYIVHLLASLMFKRGDKLAPLLTCYQTLVYLTVTLYVLATALPLVTLKVKTLLPSAKVTSLPLVTAVLPFLISTTASER